MRIVFVDTYYRRFLREHYARNPQLASESYAIQQRSLIDARFGTSDFYTKHLNDLGCEAFDLIANCVPLQAAWLRENGRNATLLDYAAPHRFYRLPILGHVVAALPGLLSTVFEQVRSLRPDVLYCHDLSLFPSWFLDKIRKHAKLVVGQIAHALPPDGFVRGYDLILTSFPHFVDRIKAKGVDSEYLRLGFDHRMSASFDGISRDVEFSFVGSLGRSHGSAIPLLERLCRETPIRIYGYGIDGVPRSSPIRERYEGEVWGLDMYRILARSRVTLNRHIGAAENFANNMRLYEATGMGALLLTERKDNLNELFAPGKEVEIYSGPDDAVEKVSSLLRDTERCATIAAAGQARTLREHTYRERMKELRLILERRLAT